jgi:hypothetical protein
MYDEEFNRPLDNVGLIDLTKNLWYYRGLNNKLDKEVGDYLGNVTNFPKSYSNDIRHQYVSALYARNLGDEWAKKLGDLNETLDGNQSGRADTEIDTINNQIGREYGSKYPEMPRQELLKKLYKDYGENLKFRRSLMGEQQ